MSRLRSYLKIRGEWCTRVRKIQQLGLAALPPLNHYFAQEACYSAVPTPSYTFHGLRRISEIIIIMIIITSHSRSDRKLAACPIRGCSVSDFCLVFRFCHFFLILNFAALRFFSLLLPFFFHSHVGIIRRHLLCFCLEPYLILSLFTVPTLFSPISLQHSWNTRRTPPTTLPRLEKPSQTQLPQAHPATPHTLTAKTQSMMCATHPLPANTNTFRSSS